MTSPLICPNCGLAARFEEIRCVHHEDDYLRCSYCGAHTDDSELAAAQPPEYRGRQLFRPTPEQELCSGDEKVMRDYLDAIRPILRYGRRNQETCAEAMDRIERDLPVSQINVLHDTCGVRGNITPFMHDWIAATFEHADRVQISRIEVHA